MMIRKKVLDMVMINPSDTNSDNIQSLKSCKDIV